MEELQRKARVSEVESLDALKAGALNGNEEAVEIIIQLYVYRNEDNEQISADLRGLVNKLLVKEPKLVAEFTKKLTNLSIERVQDRSGNKYQIKDEVNHKFQFNNGDKCAERLLIDPRFTIVAANLWLQAEQLEAGEIVGGRNIGDDGGLIDAHKAVQVLEEFIKTNCGASNIGSDKNIGENTIDGALVGHEYTTGDTRGRRGAFSGMEDSDLIVFAADTGKIISTKKILIATGDNSNSADVVIPPMEGKPIAK